MDLFEQQRLSLLTRNAPLADRMRPRTLDEFFGQEHIIGPGRLLRRAIQIDQLSSLIFYGPPGTGKTTLARIIAQTTSAQFLSINAVLSGVADIRESVHSAREMLSLHAKKTILFIDEVHRFNKAQQDALLPHVENGTIILIGATTENPYFEVNKALVSRSRIFQLRQLTDDDLCRVARAAIADPVRGFGGRNVRIDDDALDHLVATANGDARAVLNALELAVETTTAGNDGTIRIDRTTAEESIQRKAVLYDKDGDAHYDTISAFIKSIRGSDPDAALYWMGRMVYAGEDPRFIFRRMLILAGEDVGMADPHALGVVLDAARAFDYVGLPEGRFHLAHACLYLACAPKSNSSMAFFDALSAVEKEKEGEVPNHLKDSSRDKDEFGHGQGYLYPHAFRDHWVAQQYLPDVLQGKIFYQPSDQGFEKQIRDRVAALREAQVEAMVDRDQKAATPDGAPEGLTQWIRRTESENELIRIREAVLTRAKLDRSGMVLDLHARTGLLTFEAVRRGRDCSVWGLAHDEREYATLVRMAQQFEPLRRPQIIRSSLDRAITELRSAAGDTVHFESIVGRNILLHRKDKAQWVSNCAREILDDNGVIVLSESLAAQGQRLSNLLSMCARDQDLHRLLQEAEEELYSDPDDPVVNWTPHILSCRLEEEGLRISSETIHFSGKRRITPADVEHWFRDTAGTQRQSLGDRLRKRDRAGAEKLKTLLHETCDNRDMAWSSASVLLEITRPDRKETQR